MKTHTFKAEHLHAIARRCLEAAGARSEIAHTVSRILVNANLTGHDSHGVLRVPIYLQRIDQDVIDPSADPKIIRESKTTMVVDGERGLGHWTAYRALELAMEKARSSETCSIAFTRVEHIGRLGEYAEIAARAGFVGISMVGRAKPGGSRVLPFGGLVGGLGTNPIAIGIPTGDETPFVLDYATSVVAEGKLQVARSKSTPVPDGTIVDQTGRPTTQVMDFYDGGFLLPFGLHKGYALSLSTCLFSALAGNKDVEQPYFGGAFMQVIDISAFVDPVDYQETVRGFLNEIKATPPSEGHQEVLAPGDFEARNRKDRLANGIEIPDTIYRQLTECADRLGTPMDEEAVEPADAAHYRSGP